jgi:hypothetical protein
MKANIDPFTVTVSLSLSAHAQAKLFRGYQSNPHKAKQIYLNALAVYATNHYLQRLGFETDLTQSNSWNPAMQSLMDVADLVLKDCGTLECRPVLPGAEFVWVPAEVWTDRIGYVAVQFDESLRKATLLGFVERVSDSKIAIAQLRSLQALPQYLNRLRQAKPIREPVRLSQWLANKFEAGWQAVEDLFIRSQPTLNFRCGDPQSVPFENCLDVARAEHPPLAVSRSKLLHLEPTGERVVLAIGLMPTAEQEMEIWVKVSPTNDRTHLPPNLQLMVLDEAEEVVMQAQARSTESILLKFSGTVGERFSLKIALDEVGLSEAFVI